MASTAIAVPGASTRAKIFLVLSAAVTLLLYYVPYGRTIGYPLMLLSTLAHEMGHGVAALMVGGSFKSLQMWPNGSGVATWGGDVGRFALAFVAAGGLVGPAVVAAVGFALGRTARRARKGLIGFGVILLAADLLVVRGAFGLLFTGATGTICLLLGLKAKPWVSQIAMVFLAVQLSLTVFSRGDYLFTPSARTSQGVMPSDVAQMANALLLPYWFWGAVCGAVSVAVLVLGMMMFFRAGRRAA